MKEQLDFIDKKKENRQGITKTANVEQRNKRTTQPKYFIYSG